MKEPVSDTVEINGMRYKREEPKVERSIYDDVYLEKPDFNARHFRINDKSTWIWREGIIDNIYFETSLLAKSEEAQIYLTNRQKLLIRLQRSCLKMGGVIERNLKYMYSPSVNATGKGLAWAYYSCGYFNFKTSEECDSFIAANESDLEEFFNVGK